VLNLDLEAWEPFQQLLAEWIHAFEQGTDDTLHRNGLCRDGYVI